MFLHLLSREQQKLFLRVAQHLVAADEVVDLREEDALERALREIGWRREDLPKPPQSSSQAFQGLDALDSYERKAAFLFEAALLVVADDRVDPAETRALRVLASRLELPETLRERCLEVAARARRVREEAQELITPAWGAD